MNSHRLNRAPGPGSIISVATALAAVIAGLAACLLAAPGAVAAPIQADAPAGEEGEATPPRHQPRRPGPVTLRIADRSVRFGGNFRLRGSTGRPARGQVRVQAFRNGAWRTLQRVRTNRNGRFTARVRARTNTSLRVVAGDGRPSRAQRVVVLGRLKLDRTSRFVKLGGNLVISGTALPRGRRAVKVRVGGRGVVTTRTRANGRFRVRWKPKTNGDFVYRVRMLPDARSTGDASPRRRFSALRPGHASYYGPGLYGNGVACGGTLTPSTRGVAHKSLPCGTRVTIRYGNRTVVARVIDRGPYIAGRDWDLTEQTRNDLGFGGVGVVWTNR